jgi:hypothetical protein
MNSHTYSTILWQAKKHLNSHSNSTIYAIVGKCVNSHTYSTICGVGEKKCEFTQEFKHLSMVYVDLL